MPIITTIFPFLPRELKRPQATSQKTNTFKARSQTLCSQNRVFSVHEVSTLASLVSPNSVSKPSSPGLKRRAGQLQTVAKMLGHANNTRVTEVYAHLADENIEEESA